MNVPVLFLIFNRPALAGAVFDVIRQAKPQRLYVMADGPRPGHPEDANKCVETRKVIDGIDWDCELHTLYHHTNMGCGQAVISGINWFFGNEASGIILEDDCLPHADFFPYCEELLKRYQDDTRVMHINGNNFNFREFVDTQNSYSFGSYPQAWGWATWQRAWALFDESVACWPELRKGDWLFKMGWNPIERMLQRAKYDDIYRRQPRDIWDYQWQLSVFSQNGLAVVPKRNLISNIGFGVDATHTTTPRGACSALETETLDFPLRHPDIILPDPAADRRYRQIMIGNIKTVAGLICRQARGFAATVYRKFCKDAREKNEGNPSS